MNAAPASFDARWRHSYRVSRSKRTPPNNDVGRNFISPSTTVPSLFLPRLSRLSDGIHSFDFGTHGVLHPRFIQTYLSRLEGIRASDFLSRTIGNAMLGSSMGTHPHANAWGSTGVTSSVWAMGSEAAACPASEPPLEQSKENICWADMLSSTARILALSVHQK